MKDRPFLRENPSELTARDIMDNKSISKKEVLKHITQSKRRATSPGLNLTSELFENKSSVDLYGKNRSGSTTQRMQVRPESNLSMKETHADPVNLARTVS